MTRTAMLAPLAAAALLAMSAVSTAQAQEVTDWTMPPPSKTLTRAQVMAELQEWRTAGAHDAGNEAGPSDVVLERQMAMHRLAEERLARAQALEQERLAAEAAARAQASSTMAAAPSSGTTTRDGSPAADGAAAAPVEASPAADAQALPGAPIEDPAPTPSTANDAITDTTRERSERDVTIGPRTEEDSAVPEDASDVPLETEPGDAADAPRGAPPQAVEPQGIAPPEAAQPHSSAPQSSEPQSATPAAQPQSTTTPAPAGNAYGYREPADRYVPAETAPADEEAQTRPVQ